MCLSHLADSHIQVLYIPFRLIWKIRIRWTQKIALSVSLGLIVLTIVCTITRMSGIKTGRLFDSIDSIWETYWQFVAANLAIIMTAATAFRTFFVSRASNERVPEPAGSKDRWYTKGRLLLLSAFSLPSWRSKPKADVSGGDKNSNVAMELNHQIPRGTLTGIRTMINGNSRTKVENWQIMHSIDGGESEDSRPPSTKGVNAQAIKVQQHITLSFDEAC